MRAGVGDLGRGRGKIEEEEGKSWYFMGERFIWNTAAEGEVERGITKTKGAYAELSLLLPLSLHAAFKAL